MRFDQTYNKQEFIKFLNAFLPEDFSEKEEDIVIDKKRYKQIKKATILGGSDSLDLRVLEMDHNNENDPRVAIATDAFKILADHWIHKAIVIFKSKNSKNYRLSLLTITLDLNDKNKSIKRYSNARRHSYYLGPNAKINTPYKFLISKGKISDSDDLLSRFSLEVVNKDFYTAISHLFTKLVGGSLELPFVADKSQTSLEFAVRLIGRVIFCWFLREKKSNSGHSLMPNGLLSLQATKENEDYYHKILEPIFFEILNKPVKSRKDLYSTEQFNLIPYLNGGLFSPHDDDFYSYSDNKQASYHNMVKVPDNWLREFFEFLETYHFTIDENITFDEDLSIDPEMLGRIFENLLAEINPETGESARKSTGSYYTPRLIVDYMVDESLFSYLKGQTEMNDRKLRAIISYDLNDDIEISLSDKEKENIINALSDIRILDPACGSGAFPIGALQKIVFILQQTDPEGQLWFKRQIGHSAMELRRVIEREFANKNFNYIRKLGIIRENIFGIDIQPIATEISRLRCFLTLIVDENVKDEIENRGIEPLPNLDFKFVTANSLIPLPSSNQSNLFQDQEGIDDLKDLRDQFFSSTNTERHQLKDEFKELQKKMLMRMIEMRGGDELTQKLSMWDPFSHKMSPWFDPEWMFGVEGFDIVIANPPYISHYSKQSQKLEEELEKKLREYEFLAKESKKLRINSVMFFLERGYKILNRAGTLSFIMDLNIHENPFVAIRRYITEKMKIVQIVNGLTAFENVGSGQSIIIASRGNNIEDNEIEIKNGLSGGIKMIKQAKIINSEFFSWSVNDNQSMLNEIDKGSAELHELVEVHTGVAVNATEAGKQMFIKDKPGEKCYPLLLGSNSIGFSYCKPKYNKYLLYDKELEKKLNDEFDSDYFKANKSHQRPFNIRRKEEYDRPKIILRQSDVKLTATYSKDLLFGNYSLFNIFHKDNDVKLLKFILALLNSKLITHYAKKKEIILIKPGKTPQIRSGQRGPIGIRQLPIKRTTQNNQQQIVDLVDNILAITGSPSNDIEITNRQEEIREYEEQIDQLIYRIYGITKEEIKIIENSG